MQTTFCRGTLRHGVRPAVSGQRIPSGAIGGFAFVGNVLLSQHATKPERCQQDPFSPLRYRICHSADRGIPVADFSRYFHTFDFRQSY